jgi:lysophospholipase L1-like esterase
LLVAPVPILETGVFTEIFAGGAAKSRALPGPLRAVAQRLGAGFADLAAVTEVDPVDGIHLDAAAHAAIGEALAETVRRSFS